MKKGSADIYPGSEWRGQKLAVLFHASKVYVHVFVLVPIYLKMALTAYVS